jgi:flagellar assembly protein FliH
MNLSPDLQIQKYLFNYIDTGENKRDDNKGVQSFKIPDLFTQDTTSPHNYPLMSADLETKSEALLESERLLNAERNDILAKTREECEIIRANAEKEGYSAGYEKGLKEGEKVIREQYEALMRQKEEQFAKELENALEDSMISKQLVFEEHLDNLKELAVAVAEKVIGISLKSSGDLIKNMITEAIEKTKNYQWAKVYLSSSDREIIMDGDAEILNAFKGKCEQVRIEFMDDHPPGTCIIEFPDQIIDASFKTQMENVRNELDISE